jgi:hypothetical protein
MPPSRVPPLHPVTFARAFIGYNAGPGWITSPYADLPAETKFYVDHFIRFALTAEIAARLRKQGHSDEQIARALTSRDIDARAFALRTYLRGTGRQGQFSEYQKAVQVLAQAEVTVTAEPEIAGAYRQYIEHPTYRLPMSAGLRIWMALGSWSLFGADQRNTNPAVWKAMLGK